MACVCMLCTPGLRALNRVPVFGHFTAASHLNIIGGESESFLEPFLPLHLLLAQVLLHAQSTVNVFPLFRELKLDVLLPATLVLTLKFSFPFFAHFDRETEDF